MKDITNLENKISEKEEVTRITLTRMTLASIKRKRRENHQLQSLSKLTNL